MSIDLEIEHDELLAGLCEIVPNEYFSIDLASGRLGSINFKFDDVEILGRVLWILQLKAHFLSLDDHHSWLVAVNLKNFVGVSVVLELFLVGRSLLEEQRTMVLNGLHEIWVGVNLIE